MTILCGTLFLHLSKSKQFEFPSTRKIIFILILVFVWVFCICIFKALFLIIKMCQGYNYCVCKLVRMEYYCTLDVCLWIMNYCNKLSANSAQVCVSFHSGFDKVSFSQTLCITIFLLLSIISYIFYILPYSIMQEVTNCFFSYGLCLCRI